MINNQQVSIVTRTMGRLSFLKQTLPMYCKVAEADKIIIVDWGMKEDLTSLMKVMDDDRIIILQVPDKIYFATGGTRNLGVRYTDPGYILMIDCDVLLYKSPFCLIDVTSKNKFYVKSKEHICRNGLGGTCMFEKFMWEKINGYVEGLPGWGWDDDDFYRRLQRNRITRIYCLGSEFITHINHNHNIRVENMEMKGSAGDTSCKNKEILNTLDVQTQVHQKYLCNIINKNFTLMNQLI